MSTNFSANQYDDAFTPNKLANWQRPKLFDEMPLTLNGSTATISNDEGHLKPEFPRSKTASWGSFIGTWDLPKKLPGNRIDVPTGRSQQANDKLRNDWEDVRMRVTGQQWGTINGTIYKQGTRPLATMKSSGTCQTGMRFTSTNAGPAIEPASTERGGSAGGVASPSAVMDSTAECNTTSSANLTESNKIPLPQLNRPIYAEGCSQGEEMPVCAV